MSGHLRNICYGKHNVRVSKVRRPRKAAANTEQHEFVELSVNVELQGRFDDAFTSADNRSVVATDTCKNTVYCLAKDHSLDCPESFATTVAEHFVAKYDHVNQCHIECTERVWERVQDSPHSFVSTSQVTPTASATAARGQAVQVAAGFEHLMIAKTTESGFSDFHRCEFRTLPDTSDRILASEVGATWSYLSQDIDFAKTRQAVMTALLARFTDHYSHSVQETLYFMGQAALDICPAMNEITLSMPNKHHLLFDLSRFDRENENEIFVVTDEPFGYITATVSREA